LKFLSNGGSSTISENGDIEINTVALDEALAGERITCIKMDIQGAELKALSGAKELICINRPKLVICLYHKPEDIFEIPEFIIDLNLNYKIYIRHQAMFSFETILYAIPK
jgi:hypothetical protein